jgi:hypothetical protein
LRKDEKVDWTWHMLSRHMRSTDGWLAMWRSALCFLERLPDAGMLRLGIDCQTEAPCTARGSLWRMTTGLIMLALGE